MSRINAWLLLRRGVDTAVIDSCIINLKIYFSFNICMTEKKFCSDATKVNYSCRLLLKFIKSKLTTLPS